MINIKTYLVFGVPPSRFDLFCRWNQHLLKPCHTPHLLFIKVDKRSCSYKKKKCSLVTIYIHIYVNTNIYIYINFQTHICSLARYLEPRLQPKHAHNRPTNPSQTASGIPQLGTNGNGCERWASWKYPKSTNYPLVHSGINKHSRLENGPGLKTYGSYWTWGYSSQLCYQKVYPKSGFSVEGGMSLSLPIGVEF